MLKRKNLNSLLGIAALAMLFGAPSIYAQSSSSDSSMGAAGANTMNAAGATEANREGKMSPAGQADVPSTKPMTGDTSSGASGTSGTSGSSMGAAGANTMNAAGATEANQEGKMSPAGQGDIPSVKPTTGSASSGASASSGSSAAGGSLSKSDQTMVNDLAYANMSEIQAAKIALDKSSNPQVKDFAQKMIDDHTKAEDQVQQLAQAKGVTLPNDLDKKHQAEIDKLAAMSGTRFDKTYLNRGGVTDHRKTVALLNRVEKRAKDPELKTLASNLLPTIKEHLQMAKAAKSGKQTSATGSSGTAGSSSSSESSSNPESSNSSGTSTTPGAAGSSGTMGK